MDFLPAVKSTDTASAATEIGLLARFTVLGYVENPREKGGDLATSEYPVSVVVRAREHSLSGWPEATADAIAPVASTVSWLAGRGRRQASALPGQPLRLVHDPGRVGMAVDGLTTSERGLARQPMLHAPGPTPLAHLVRLY